MESDHKIASIKRRRRRRTWLIPKFGCFRIRSDYGYPTVDRPDGEGNLDMESAAAGIIRSPTHLIVTVNGIVGSAQNWRYAAKQFLKTYPQDVIVHCSECNPSMLTFDGVDVMGNRLADEIMTVVERYPELQKISFVGHSLGGLVARYAIAKLYGNVITVKSCQQESGRECTCDDDDDDDDDESKDSFREERSSSKGKIAGLEPLNFITSATPHLGSRGHKQTPALCGVYSMEKLATGGSWFLGRTGKHLFLRDGGKEKPPLLLQMVKDRDDLAFLSALRAFKRRVVYANTRFDQFVGWSTSSIRRRSELPKLQQVSRIDKYPHIVNVETAKTANIQEEISIEYSQVSRCKSTSDMEEAMIKGLTKVSWERVDVDFGGSKQRFLAHSTIQVKSYRMNSDGADVIQHMVDNFLL